MATNSQELVNVREIRGDTLLLENGSYCQIIMVGGTNFSLKSEMEQNGIILAYQDFLNTLDFSIQMIVHSRKINIENYLRELDKRKAQETSGLLQNQIAEYQEFVRSFVKENAIMKKIFLVMVPYYPSVLPTNTEAIGKVVPGFGKKAPPANREQQEEEELAFKKNLNQLKQRVDQVTEGLRTIGLETTLLTGEQLVELFYNFYNPETIEKEGVATER